MYVSHYNLDYPLKDGKSILFNPLSGAMDLVDKEVIHFLHDIEGGKKGSTDGGDVVLYLQERGYVYSHIEDEKKKINTLFQVYQDWSSLVPRNFVLSTTYSCNLDCKYCFQGQKRQRYSNAPIYMSDKILDAAFSFMKKINAEVVTGGKSEITIYGGEPLQKDERHRKIIYKALKLSREMDFRILVITNGTCLKDYMDLLIEYKVDELQVTLDGPQEVHDRRRPYVLDRLGSFWNIVEGIELALGNGLVVSLRFVGDRDNIHSAPDLVKFMKERGWYDKPNFKSHIGRMCCGVTPEYDHQRLNSKEFTEKLIDIYETDRDVGDKVPSRFVGLDRLFTTGMVYPPLFDACPGTKLEYALDAVGHIYPCSLGVGMPEFLVGEYYPEIKFYPDKLEKWRKRNVLNDPKCFKCKVAFLCGGGCPRDALETHGTPHAPACRPVIQSLADGIEYYLPNILALIDGKKMGTAGKGCCP